MIGKLLMLILILCSEETETSNYSNVQISYNRSLTNQGFPTVTENLLLKWTMLPITKWQFRYEIQT